MEFLRGDNGTTTETGQRQTTATEPDRMPPLPKASLRTAAEEEEAAAQEAATLLALRHSSATILAKGWRARPRWPPDYAIDQLYDVRLSADVGYDVSRWCRFEAGVFDEPSLAYVALRCVTLTLPTRRRRSPPPPPPMPASAAPLIPRRRRYLPCTTKAHTAPTSAAPNSAHRP